jgi:soluble lytic murein transglycosylase-like protein
MNAPRIESRTSRPLAAASLGILLLVAAPCARPPSPDARGAGSGAAAPEERELAVVRDRLAPLAAELGPKQRDALAATLLRTSREHALPPTFVLAVIEVESRFDPFAVSPRGALGLMQVMPATGAEVARRRGLPWRGPHTLFDPELNVRIGVAYLRELVDRYASVRAALAAYNWGPGQIDARLRGGETLPVHYPTRVLDAYSAARRTES